jgi:hypothetical protein
MEEIINNLNFINDNDKSILLNASNNNMDIKILKSMSIFSHLGNLKKIDEYDYFETNDGEDIFYLKNCYDIFIDKNKKILLPSRYFFSCDINLFIDHISNLLSILEHLDLDKESTFDIGNNIISIEKWFETFGHFKDEMFIMADFCNKKNLDNSHTCFNSYKYITENINYNKKNYDQLSNFLFNKHFNAYSTSEYIIKMKNVKLILHSMGPSYFHTFHSFPKTIRDKIYQQSELELNQKNKTTEKYKNIFITRNTALHLPRNLSNQKEIEEYLSSLGYFILNPEDISQEEFINIIRYAENIFITWGGALVNMIYLQPNTNVTILKSKSYSAEDIWLFQKIIDTYELKVNVVECNDENIIDISKLNINL